MNTLLIFIVLGSITAYYLLVAWAIVTTKQPRHDDRLAIDQIESNLKKILDNDKD